MRVSIVILTHNEEKNILDCIESITFADEVIIVDDNSEDRTVETVRGINRKDIRVFSRKLNGDFFAQRNFGLSKATGDWVLFLDADERLSEGLAEEIRLKTQNQNSDAVGYWIRRRDKMWGRELTHGEMGSMKLMRFAKKDAGAWRGKVHEVWDVKGKVGILDNALMHYPHQTIHDFLREVSFYSTLRAEELHESHKQVSLWEIIIYPKAKFVLNYFVRLGFLDGIPGFIVAVMMSLHSFLVRVKLWLLNQK